MIVSNLTVVFHPKCAASLNFLIKVKELQDIDIEYINYTEDSFETDIDIDVVPLIIINNDSNKIFKGKSAFDKIEDIKLNNSGPSKSKRGLSYGKKSVTFIQEDSSDKKKIDLDAKY